jgi:hypothetical protein
VLAGSVSATGAGRMAPAAAGSAAEQPHVCFFVVAVGAGGENVELLICSAVTSMPSAAVFSSTREARLVLGIGAMSSSLASS